MSTSETLTEKVRRVLDIVVASSGLLILSPLMAAIAAAILLETGRPVFYCQTRIGKGGREFRIIKFRKFYAKTGDDGPLLTIRGDSRMTRIGRVLERTKLDELPQFLNVLRGEMAIVGPRPETAVAIDRLFGEYRLLLNYKPGIFGPAQVAFRNAGTLYPEHVNRHTFYREVILPMKATLDLAYYPHRTLFGDLTWIIRGVLVVFGLYPTVRKLPPFPIASPGERLSGATPHN